MKSDEGGFSTTTSSSRKVSIVWVDRPSPQRADSLGQHEGMCVVRLSQDDSSSLSY